MLADHRAIGEHDLALRQELAEALMVAASGPSDILSRIRSGFPTSAAVAFAFDANGRPAFDGFFQPDPLG